MFTRRYRYLVPYKRNFYTQEEKEAVMRVLDEGSGGEAWGPEYQTKDLIFFEQEFVQYIGKKYGIMLDACLHSIYLLLLLQGIGPGDEVITHANIEPADVTIIAKTGAKPVLVDIEAETFNIDVTKIEEKITPQTKAIFPLHAHGQTANMTPILELADKYDLFVVEDCTHTIGAKYKGEKLPLGDVGVIGLYLKGMWVPTGGAMVVSDNKELIDKLHLLRTWHGRRATGEVEDANGNPVIHGLKIMPDPIAPAVGRIQLRHLDEYITQQRKKAQIYTELLEDTPEVITPIEKEYAFHTYLRYMIRTERRDALQEFLWNASIDSHILYPTPAHLYPYYENVYGYKKGDFPVTVLCKDTELCLPEPRPRTQWELEYITTKIKEFFG